MVWPRGAVSIATVVSTGPPTAPATPPLTPPVPPDAPPLPVATIRGPELTHAPARPAASGSNQRPSFPPPASFTARRVPRGRARRPPPRSWTSGRRALRAGVGAAGGRAAFSAPVERGNPQGRALHRSQPAAGYRSVPRDHFLVTMISARRFLARPSAVSLGAMGCSWPNPTASTREESTPRATSRLRMASEREVDRARLASGSPVLSVKLA